MRLGFIGPCRSDVNAIRPLAELLLFELACDRVVYLGADNALDLAIRGWAERFGAPPDDAAFLTEAALLAPDAPPEIIDALLARDRKRARLADLAALPPPPSRAVEMIDDRVVLMVYDKAVLDEDDVANATAIVWGNAPEGLIKPIGPRIFLSPGVASAASGPSVATIELTDDAMLCVLRDGSGAVQKEHRTALVRAARVGVQ